jgi:hypothetical protein
MPGAGAADRVWRTRTQLELAVVAWVGWFNHDRLHDALGDLPPAEFGTAERLSAPRTSPSESRTRQNHVIPAPPEASRQPPRCARRRR